MIITYYKSALNFLGQTLYVILPRTCTCFTQVVTGTKFTVDFGYLYTKTLNLLKKNDFFSWWRKYSTRHITIDQIYDCRLIANGGSKGGRWGYGGCKQLYKRKKKKRVVKHTFFDLSYVYTLLHKHAISINIS